MCRKDNVVQFVTPDVLTRTEEPFQRGKIGIQLLVSIVPVMGEKSVVLSLIVPHPIVRTIIFLKDNVVLFVAQNVLMITDESFQKDKAGNQLLVSIVLVVVEKLCVLLSIVLYPIVRTIMYLKDNVVRFAVRLIALLSSVIVLLVIILTFLKENVVLFALLIALWLIVVRIVNILYGTKEDVVVKKRVLRSDVIWTVQVGMRMMTKDVSFVNV